MVPPGDSWYRLVAHGTIWWVMVPLGEAIHTVQTGAIHTLTEAIYTVVTEAIHTLTEAIHTVETQYLGQL